MSDKTREVMGTALETVIIFTSRMEELAAFYQQALQLGTWERSIRHMGQWVGPVYLGFDHYEAAGTGAASGVTLWFTVDDLQATYDRAISLGAEVRNPPTPKPWGAILASVRDPDGNLLGLAQRQSDAS